MTDWTALYDAIGRAVGRRLVDARQKTVGGGSVSQTLCVEDHESAYFVKIETPGRLGVLEAEAAGLDELRQASLMRIPELITHGASDDMAYLVLEYISMAPADDDALLGLGDALAEMHGIVAPQYGWRRDNMIGMNAQYNAHSGDWVEFWRENRLRVMVDALAPDYPQLARLGDRLLTSLDTLLAGHQPEASLLHGDLWPGNVGFDVDKRPILFDPAVYYGDRETDLAMAELFGGLSPMFLESYWNAWPMSAEYKSVRRPLYQLYHLLNHVRQFGGSYVARSRQTLEKLLAHARG